MVDLGQEIIMEGWRLDMRVSTSAHQVQHTLLIHTTTTLVQVATVTTLAHSAQHHRHSSGSVPVRVTRELVVAGHVVKGMVLQRARCSTVGGHYNSLPRMTTSVMVVATVILLLELLAVLLVLVLLPLVLVAVAVVVAVVAAVVVAVAAALSSVKGSSAQSALLSYLQPLSSEGTTTQRIWVQGLALLLPTHHRQHQHRRGQLGRILQWW
jgi:hypothetical protein